MGISLQQYRCAIGTFVTYSSSHRWRSVKAMTHNVKKRRRFMRGILLVIFFLTLYSITHTIQCSDYKNNFYSIIMRSHLLKAGVEPQPGPHIKSNDQTYI